MLNCDWSHLSVPSSAAPLFCARLRASKKEEWCREATFTGRRVGQRMQAAHASEAASSKVLPSFSLEVYLNARVLSQSIEYFLVITVKPQYSECHYSELSATKKYFKTPTKGGTLKVPYSELLFERRSASTKFSWRKTETLPSSMQTTET